MWWRMSLLHGDVSAFALGWRQDCFPVFQMRDQRPDLLGIGGARPSHHSPRWGWCRSLAFDSSLLCSCSSCFRFPHREGAVVTPRQALPRRDILFMITEAATGPCSAQNVTVGWRHVEAVGVLAGVWLQAHRLFKNCCVSAQGGFW